MKIYTRRDTAQDILDMLRNHGALATLFSTSLDRNESIVVVKSIPEKIRQWVSDLAIRIDED